MSFNGRATAPYERTAHDATSPMQFPNLSACLAATCPDSLWTQDWTGAAWCLQGGEDDETDQMKTNLQRAVSQALPGLMELSRPSTCSSVVGGGPHWEESGKWGGVQL